MLAFPPFEIFDGFEQAVQVLICDFVYLSEFIESLNTGCELDDFLLTVYCDISHQRA